MQIHWKTLSLAPIPAASTDGERSAFRYGLIGMQRQSERVPMTEYRRACSWDSQRVRFAAPQRIPPFSAWTALGTTKYELSESSHFFTGANSSRKSFSWAHGLTLYLSWSSLENLPSVAVYVILSPSRLSVAMTDDW